jgi:hypothetical protein
MSLLLCIIDINNNIGNLSITSKYYYFATTIIVFFFCTKSIGNNCKSTFTRRNDDVDATRSKSRTEDQTHFKYSFLFPIIIKIAQSICLAGNSQPFSFFIGSNLYVHFGESRAGRSASIVYVTTVYFYSQQDDERGMTNKKISS